MYYYVFEHNQSGLSKGLGRNIKDLIAQTGIAGETVSPSPARTLEELTQIGIDKGYSTVVAVGSDSHANQVASALLRARHPQDQKIVFGVVPVDYKQGYLAELIGVNSLAAAIDSLKFRKLSELSVGAIDPNIYFILPAQISFAKTTSIQIVAPDFETVLTATDVNITKDLLLIAYDSNFTGSALARAWAWLLGKQTANRSQTVLRQDKFTIAAGDSHPVTVAGQIVAKTPVSIRRARKALHFIVSRDRIK